MTRLRVTFLSLKSKRINDGKAASHYRFGSHVDHYARSTEIHGACPLVGWVGWRWPFMMFPDSTDQIMLWPDCFVMPVSYDGNDGI